MSDRLRHVARVLGQPWAITPEMFSVVCEIVDRRVAGIRLTPEQIDDLIAESRAEFQERHASPGFYAAIPGGNPGSNGSRGDSIAVISLYGTILPRPVANVSGGGGVALSSFQKVFSAADADPSVKAILLDVDSPGGSVELVPETAALIRGAQTPVTAIANTMAGSAAYYLASQANELVVTPSGSVGSIGVFARHVDMSGALAQDGVDVTLISAGKFKTEGNPYGPLGDEAKAALQAQVDEFYGMFVDDVARGRGVTSDAVIGGYGEGRMLLASQALAAGMVDRIDTLDGTLAAMLARGPQQGKIGLRGDVVAAGLNADADPDDSDDDEDDIELDDVIEAEPLIPIDQETSTPAPVAEEPDSPAERPSGADKPALLPWRIARKKLGL